MEVPIYVIYCKFVFALLYVSSNSDKDSDGDGDANTSGNVIMENYLIHSRGEKLAAAYLDPGRVAAD